MLKNIVFSGVGLVRNPANERSVIKKSYKQVVANEFFGGEEMNELETSLAEANKTIESNKVLIQELKDTVEAKASEIEELKTQLKTAKSKIAEFEKEVVVANRKSQLSKLRLSDEEVEAMLTKFESVDENTFSEIVKIKAEAMKCEDEEEDEEVEVEAEVEETDDLGVGSERFDEVAQLTEYFSKALKIKE